MREQRLIDANKVDPSEVFCGSSGFAEDVRNGVGVLISYQPTIDPETLPIVQALRAELAKRPPVVHAHWIDNTYCSHCNGFAEDEEGHIVQQYSEYCKDCGAKMDGE